MLEVAGDLRRAPVKFENPAGLVFGIHNNKHWPDVSLGLYADFLQWAK